MWAGTKQMHSILIVAGEHDMRVSLRRFLESENYKVYTSTNGKDALTLLYNIPPPDIIILDEDAPMFMTTQEFLNQKNEISDLRKIPVVLMSMKENNRDIIGMSGILYKPFEMSKVLEII